MFPTIQSTKNGFAPSMSWKVPRQYCVKCTDLALAIWIGSCITPTDSGHACQATANTLTPGAQMWL